MEVILQSTGSNQLARKGYYNMISHKVHRDRDVAPTSVRGDFGQNRLRSKCFPVQPLNDIFHSYFNSLRCVFNILLA